jgi:hypothetical protein
MNPVKRFTPDEIYQLRNDPTRIVTKKLITAPGRASRSWEEQADRIRLLTDYLLERLESNIDTQYASAELARLSGIVRAHLPKTADGSDNPEEYTREQLEAAAKEGQ